MTGVLQKVGFKTKPFLPKHKLTCQFSVLPLIHMHTSQIKQNQSLNFQSQWGYIRLKLGLLKFGRWQLIFWRHLVSPSSSAMKTKATVFSEMLVSIHKTIWCHIPEAYNLNIHHCNGGLVRRLKRTKPFELV
jgi:hypothetical protein